MFISYSIFSKQASLRSKCSRESEVLHVTRASEDSGRAKIGARAKMEKEGIPFLLSPQLGATRIFALVRHIGSNDLIYSRIDYVFLLSEGHNSKQNTSPI